jgi:hypothetical protein
MHLGPQELGIPNLPHLFPFIPHDFEESEIPDFTIGINEEVVNGFPEIWRECVNSLNPMNSSLNKERIVLFS